jgi:hypothetical protein
MTVVYFISPAGEYGPVKIGCTKNIKKRLTTLSRCSSKKLEVLAAAQGSFDDERRLHMQFNTHRSHGEWFHRNEDIDRMIAFVSKTGILPDYAEPSIPAPDQTDVVFMAFRKTNASTIIDALGGTTAVSRLLNAPVSTVHSWRTIGIPASRLAHIRLVAKIEGKTLPQTQEGS